ncbi:MAG TPA: hypothetical protein VNN07_08435 [Candidatus Tectomicrobia bacterium]|nr:hypothetical protein [Candidatus Tectomicrobia bacterium]
MYRGRARRHDLPARRKRDLYGTLPDDDSDETTWAYHADWQALDEVVSYWDGEVARILTRLATPRGGGDPGGLSG